MVDTINPLVVIQDTLVQVAADWQPLVDLLGLNGTPPEKMLHLMQSGDQPNIRIRPYRGGGANFKSTSSSNSFMQNFEIGLWVMNEQNDGLIPIDFWNVKWQLMCAFNQAFQDDQVLGLPDKGVNATAIRFLDISEDDQNQDFNQGNFGWVSLTIVSVTFTVKTANMR